MANLEEDKNIAAARDIARRMDQPAQKIENDIRGLNKFLSGMDLEANSPDFHTGFNRPQVGGAGMPVVPKTYEDAIKEAQKNYEHVGLRTVENPIVGKIKNSFVWIDGKPTNKKLKGVSATDVNDKASRMMHRLTDEKSSNYYFGPYTYVVGSNSADFGEDRGEKIMHDPKVLFGGHRETILKGTKNSDPSNPDITKAGGGRAGYAEGGGSNMVDDPIANAVNTAKSVDLSHLPGAVLQPYEPSWKDRLASWMLGDEKPSLERERFVEGLVGSSGLGPTGISVSDFVPVAGQILSGQQAAHEGDYRGTAMAVLPMGGTLGAELGNLERSALKGLAYETAQHGPFYRVYPRKTGEEGSVISRTGEEIWPGSPSEAPRGGSTSYGTTQYDPTTGKSAPLMPTAENNVPLQSANKYVKSIGLPEFSQPEMPRSSLAKQSAIGRTFDLAAEGSPEYKAAIFDAYGRMMPDVVEKSGAKNYDQLLEAAYRQMAKETSDQFDALPLRYSFHRAGEGNYENSPQMVSDVHNNGHLFVYQGGDKHDFLHNIDPETGLNENEKFRAVHDAFGHAILGNTFGPQGEERAWAAHSRMYSPLAQLAMTAETRGQNSVVNYTPLNMKTFDQLGQIEMRLADAIKAGNADEVAALKAAKAEAMKDWQFAPQKAVLLPPEFLSTEYTGGMPDYIRPLIRPEEGTAFSSSLAHFSRNPNMTMTDPTRYGTGLKGAERERLHTLPGGVLDRSYFYLGDPRRVSPEPGLGPVRYGARSENLYDWNKDPSGLWAIAQELNRAPATAKYDPAWINMPQAMNDVERLAKEYGYSGIANPKHRHPMAIMFDPTPVQKVRAGGGRTMGNNAIDNALRMAQSMGRNGDTILAHINPEEAALLKAHGGSGKINPYTGLPEFGFDDGPERGATGSSGSTGYNAGYGGGSSSSSTTSGSESSGGGGGDGPFGGGSSGVGTSGGGSDRSSPTSDPVREAIEKELPNKMTGVEGATPIGMPTSIKELMSASNAAKVAQQQQDQDLSKALDLAKSSFFSPDGNMMGFNVNPSSPKMSNVNDIGTSTGAPIGRVGETVSPMGFKTAQQSMDEARGIRTPNEPSWSGTNMNNFEPTSTMTAQQIMNAINQPVQTPQQQPQVSATSETNMIWDPVQQSNVKVANASAEAIDLAIQQGILNKDFRTSIAAASDNPAAKVAALNIGVTNPTQNYESSLAQNQIAPRIGMMASIGQQSLPRSGVASVSGSDLAQAAGTPTSAYDVARASGTPTSGYDPVFTALAKAAGTPTSGYDPVSAALTQAAGTPTSGYNPVSAALARAAGTPTSGYNPVSNVASVAPIALASGNVPFPIARPSDLNKAVALAKSESTIDPDLLGGVDLPASTVKTATAPTSGVPMPTPRPESLKSEPNFMSQIIDSIRSDLAFKEGERINALEAAGKTATFPGVSTASDPLAAQREYVRAIGLNPDNPEDMAKVQARIIQQDGQDRVDYYTKTLGEALFGPFADMFGKKTGAPVTSGGGGGGGGGGQPSSGSSGLTGPGRKKILYPYQTELGESVDIPSLDGTTAQQFANQYAGGDLSKVHGSLDWSTGAPRVVYHL